MRDEPLDTPLPTAFSFLPPPEDRCAQCPEYSKKQVRSVVGCFVCAFIGLLIFSSLLATWFAGQMDMNSVNSTHTHTHTSSSTSTATTTTTTTSSATTSNSGTTQTPAGYDECLSNSWAPAGVSRLVSAVSANPDQLLVDTNFQTAATFLFNAFRASSSRFSVGLMYGLPNGDCYSLMDCSADSFINSAPCTGVTRYFLFIRNQAYFGDTVLRAFAVNTTNGKLASNYYYTGSVAYDTTARPWYVQQQGWSAVYQFADMAIQGRSYSTTLPLSSGGSVVIAGDRVSTEPCGACLAASFAVPWAEGWASQNQYGKNALTSQASVNGYLTSMLSYVRQFSNETFYSVYVGFSSNDFYQIIDCANPSATLTCRNRINAANSPYIAIVRNQAVFGTSNRVSFEMTASGGVGAQIETLSAFPTTTRPWYLIGHGWSDIYTFVSNGQQGRSYSANFNDGVAAADAILDSSQRCSLGRLTCS